MPLYRPAPLSETVVGSTSAPTSTSASFAVIPQMTLTVTTHGGKLLVMFTGTFNLQHDDDWRLAIFSDGVETVQSEGGLDFFGGSLLGLTPGRLDKGPAVLHALISGLSVGSHTIDVRWIVDGGTARAVGIQRQLTLIEII